MLLLPLILLPLTDGYLGDEDRLTATLFHGYNSLVRPVPNATSPPIQVAFSLALVLLISLDEKNQILQTNVWPTMRWTDYQMRWDPREYGGIETIRVPPDKVFLPDIVLFNNADGNYLVSFYSNVVVEYTGQMLWVPPAVYKSVCVIDVEFFPFDGRFKPYALYLRDSLEQVCSLTFGSWTFRKDEVQLTYLEGKKHVELNDYSASGIWDVMECPGHLIEGNSKISYQIRIRRKTLFYTFILIMPTVLMAFLSMMVFYLPAEASEKITLAISILLALVVFLLLVSKILPPTSSTIPLMARYLLLTFILNMITIASTVVIINFYFRSPATHVMSDWTRLVFLQYLPIMLVMKRPDFVKRKRTSTGEINETTPLCQVDPSEKRLSSCSTTGDKKGSRRNTEDGLSEQAQKAIDAIQYITEHLTQDNKYKTAREEWRFVSMVIDRLLLYIFFGVTATGTMTILCSAPTIFEYVDQATVLKNLRAAAAASQNSSMP